MSARRLAIALVVACAWPAAEVGAQGDAPVIQGRVVDETRGAIVGAVLTLEDATGATRTARTDREGAFRFPGLAAGAYVLRAVAEGFAPHEARVEVAPPGRSVVSVEVVLHVARRERVDVTAGAGGLTPGGGLTTVTLSGPALAALPDSSTQMLRRLRELAGSTGRPGDVSVFVNGFRQAGRLPPKSAIQMIRISTNPFAPEFAEPGRARIEIITKPGTAEVHGEIKTAFNDDSMNARSPLAARAGDEAMRNVTGYLSSAALPGRWGFLLYAGQWSDRVTDVVNATVLDPGSLAPVPFVANVTAPDRIRNVWLNQDVGLSPRATLAVSVGHTREVARNQGLGSGLDLPERAFTRTSSETLLRVALNAIPSNRVLHAAHVELARRRAGETAAGEGPAVIVLDAFHGGANQGALRNEARSTAVQMSDHLTLLAGRHTVKVGADFYRAAHHDADRTNFGGTFRFGADFERDAAGRVVTDADGEAVPIPPIEAYRRTRLGLPGYGPSQFSAAVGAPEVRFSQTWFGWFLQDDWVVRPALTLSYGFRHEVQTDVPGALALRLGGAWAVDAARTTTLRFGTGLFAQRLESGLLLDLIRLDGVHQREVLVTRPAFFPVVPPDLGGAAGAPVVYVRDAALDAPRTWMAAGAIERQLPRAMFASASYTFTRGTRLLRTRNVNAPPEAGAPPPRPDRGPVLQYESTARSRRHELALGWRWDPGPRLNATANYIFTSASSDTDNRHTAPASSVAPAGELGPPAAERPHQATAGASVRWKDVAFSAYVTVSSGRAFNITTGYDNNGDGLFTDRPARAAAGEPGAILTRYGWLNPSPGPGDPVITRNAGRESAQARVDLHVSRGFRLPGRESSVVVAADVQNLFNRANYAGFNGVLTSASFGEPRRALDPRRVEVSIGWSF